MARRRPLANNSSGLYRLSTDRPWQEAEYAARTIRAFLNGSSGEWDWDDFTSFRLRDREVDNLRSKALKVDLPVNPNGEAELRALANEADRLATLKGD